jgi:hypothetical protein
MKYIWEEKDITSGILLKKEGAHNSKALMIFYGFDSKSVKYGLITVCGDPAVSLRSKENLVAYLNFENSNYIPLNRKIKLFDLIEKSDFE